MIEQLKRGVLVGAAALALTACGGGDADEGRKLYQAQMDCKADQECVTKATEAYVAWATKNPEAATKLGQEIAAEAQKAAEKAAGK